MEFFLLFFKQSAHSFQGMINTLAVNDDGCFICLAHKCSTIQSTLFVE